MSPAAEDSYGCGHYQIALHCATTVPEMPEAQALCTALLSGPGATKNAIGALSLNKLMPELILEEISACASLLELEEDF
ncbi:hypothetical protein C0989_012453 [Termitomyces sp. Mn162]|nr:hypothetical protein C0989_012453 [Termitomyces sp. Mn162]